MIDLTWITDTLALGGSFSPAQTALLPQDHGVAAVVDLRGEESDDAQLLAKYRVEFLHLPTIEFAPISPAMMRRGTSFVLDHLAAGRRVLVHCGRGIGRSAVLVLSVLVELGRTPLDALVLTRQRRPCVAPSTAQYEALAAWLAVRRAERGAVWPVPTVDQLKAIAYRRRQSPVIVAHRRR